MNNFTFYEKFIKFAGTVLLYQKYTPEGTQDLKARCMVTSHPKIHFEAELASRDNIGEQFTQVHLLLRKSLFRIIF